MPRQCKDMQLVRLGNATTFGYDANGNLAGRTDALSNHADIGYDA